MRQMLEIGPRTDMHMQARDAQAITVGPEQTILHLLVPNPVLRLFTTGVGLLTMTVAKAWIDPQCDLFARSQFAVLIDHLR